MGLGVGVVRATRAKGQQAYLVDILSMGQRRSQNRETLTRTDERNSADEMWLQTQREFVQCSMFNTSLERKRPQRMFMVTQLNVIDFFS